MVVCATCILKLVDWLLPSPNNCLAFLKHLCKALHKCFKAMKQNLQIKTFRGQWLAAYNLIVIYFILFDDFGY